MTVRTVLQAAVRDQVEVRVWYAEEDEARVCHPHVLFANSSGREQVEAYQVAGVSSRTLPAWRCLDVDQIRRVERTGRAFEVEAGYHPLNRDRYPTLLCWIGQPRLVR